MSNTSRPMLGRIQRKLLWQALGPEEFPELRIVNETSRTRFSNLIRSRGIAAEPDDHLRADFAKLTARTYLRYARACYDSAFGTRGKRSDEDCYRAFAEGRHGGLLDLCPNDHEAFCRWYGADASGGAHPFEIVRDRVVLFPHRLSDRTSFVLRLASWRRSAIEPHLIRMALGLHDARIPFYLENGKAYAELARGDDWIAVIVDQAGSHDDPRALAIDEIVGAAQPSVLVSQLTPFGLIESVEWTRGPIDDQHHNRASG